MTTAVTVLFARRDSVYKELGCDVYDIDRNALTWPGGGPCIAHPPCRAWGAMRGLSTAPESERELARWAVAQVCQWGGVLEHPARSTLWEDQSLPLPGKGHDPCGGFTLSVLQWWWGHKAPKSTWLYVVGCKPKDVPEIPIRIGEATHCIAQSNRRQKLRLRPEVTKAEREHTPRAFAEWLIALAQRCEKGVTA